MWLLSQMCFPGHCGVFSKGETMLGYFKALEYHKVHDSLTLLQNLSQIVEGTVVHCWDFTLISTEASRTPSPIPPFSLFWCSVPFVCVCMWLDVFKWLNDSQLLLSSRRQSGAHTHAQACFALPALTHVFHLAICWAAWYIREDGWHADAISNISCKNIYA